MPSSGLCCHGRPQSENKESENRDKYLDLARALKAIEREGDGDTNRDCCTWDNPQRIETGRLGNKKISREYPDYSIIKISQNTEKSPEDLMRLAVTTTQVRSHQLALVWKSLKRENNKKCNHGKKSRKLR